MPRYTASEFERILVFVRKERAQEAEKLCIGTPKTWEAYREAVTRIQTFDAIESEMAKITGTANTGEEDL